MSYYAEPEHKQKQETHAEEEEEDLSIGYYLSNPFFKSKLYRSLVKPSKDTLTAPLSEVVFTSDNITDDEDNYSDSTNNDSEQYRRISSKRIYLKFAFFYLITLAAVAATLFFLPQGLGLHAVGICIGSIILGAACGFFVYHYPEYSLMAGPLLAISQGGFLGSILVLFGDVDGDSIIFDFLAVALLAIAGAALLLYSSGFLQNTSSSIKASLSLGIGSALIMFFVYLVLQSLGVKIDFVEHCDFLVIISFLIIAFFDAQIFVRDMKSVALAFGARAPEFIEWYCACGLTVSISWFICRLDGYRSWRR